MYALYRSTAIIRILSACQNRRPFCKAEDSRHSRHPCCNGNWRPVRIGLGIQPPAVSWGTLLQDAQSLQVAPPGGEMTEGTEANLVLLPMAAGVSAPLRR